MRGLSRARLILVLLVALLAFLPALAGNFIISLFNDIGMAALVVLGLVLLSGVGGTVSFGQAAFVGVAAYASAWLTLSQGMSPWLGLVFALAVTGASAVVIGLLTLRLGGHYLPMSTIAWGLSIALLFGNVEALGRHSGLSGIAPLSLGPWKLATAASVYYLVWGLVGLVAAFSHFLLNSRIGRVIRALRGGSILLASVGADAAAIRMALFILAALFAALAGWLYAHVNRFVSPAPFALHASIDYMFMMVAGGLAQLSGAVFGSGLMLLMKSALQDLLPLLTKRGSQVESLVFAVLFLLLLHHARAGVAGYLARWQNGLTRVPRIEAGPEGAVPPLARRTLPAVGTPLLKAQEVSKNFGGLVAVNTVGFELKAGEILGLIGPNGAGKTTMFNLLTGTLPLSGGRVRFLGRDVTGKSQRAIALMGVARTFQHVKLRPQMSLLDNVALGAHARGRCGILKGGLALNRAEEGQIFAEANRQLDRIGLGGRGHELAGSLPLGTQRILEIARALASDPVLLILDEPAAGLRRPEKRELAALLRRLRDEGLTILIVEHDMDFVMNLVDRLVVMNFGSKLFEGTPREARSDAGVRAAYLGNAS
ncbi:MAG: branched-chain amino acid ABC transporter ATP-binding protein/permease [Rhodospirillales bacterium]|nr:branched-chain amino acid ABC transporter ATP-binding protein/permease [Rhodospirillales bacterium]